MFSFSLKLKEENGERAELVISLSKDKSAFEKRLDELNKEMHEVGHILVEAKYLLSYFTLTLDILYYIF